MTAEMGDFDLNAAGLRRASGDMRAFAEALAVRLEGALPTRVSVERRRDGLLSRTRHVAKIAVRFEGSILVLEFEHGQPRARRAKVVGGITIGSEDMGLPQWLDAVARAAQVAGEQAGAAHGVLHDFLLS